MFRAGFPYKSPQELGLSSVDDAYYSTQAAIFNYIYNGADEASLSKWTFNSSESDRNWLVLQAMANIYKEGIENPYTPPNIEFAVMPLEDRNNGTATEEGDWGINSYKVATDYPHTYYADNRGERILG